MAAYDPTYAFVACFCITSRHERGHHMGSGCTSALLTAVLLTKQALCLAFVQDDAGWDVRSSSVMYERCLKTAHANYSVLMLHTVPCCTKDVFCNTVKRPGTNMVPVIGCGKECGGQEVRSPGVRQLSLTELMRPRCLSCCASVPAVSVCQPCTSLAEDSTPAQDDAHCISCCSHTRAVVL